jgi:hypothetical protein
MTRAGLMRRILASRPTRCVDGRLMRHDPQFDDPDLETDVGECPECEGDGCKECDCCGNRAPVSRCWLGPLETFACDECRGIE